MQRAQLIPFDKPKTTITNDGVVYPSSSPTVNAILQQINNEFAKMAENRKQYLESLKEDTDVQNS